MPDLHSLKLSIWTACGKCPVTVQVAADKAGVRLPITQVHEAEKLLKAIQKRKVKKKGANISPELYKRYRDAKYAYEVAKFPQWVGGGHFIEPDCPTDDTNGLTDLICNYLNWTGHFANRTGNEGRSIVKNGKTIRIPSSSINGMQDIDSNLQHPQHPHGIPWKMEVKAGRDTHKDHQKDFGKRVSKTGGVYSVVKSAEDFFSQLDKLLILQPIQTTLL